MQPQISTRPDLVAKELSWLSFNERVLQEAKDRTVPLIERIRFLGIFSSNLDEFFRVRVAELKRLILIENEGETHDAGERLLKEIQLKLHGLQEQFDEVYRQILLELARRNIFLVNEQQLSARQGEWVRQFFQERIALVLSPILLDEEDELPSLQDDLIYLAIDLRLVDGRQLYGLLEVPTRQFGRFIPIPVDRAPRKKSYIILDNIIRYCLREIYQKVFDVESVAAYTVKVTRDAELELSEGISQSLLDKLSSSLKRRLSAEPVRLVYDREMPARMTNFFIRKLKLSSYDSMIPGGRYHNFKDFIDFPDVGRRGMLNPPLPELRSAAFDRHRNSFDAIAAGDILLYYPYHSFRHFTDWLREAAIDPQVTRIAISLYRVARNSQVVNAMMTAARNGKQVKVIVELRARFDEQANIEWAKTLTEAGVEVEFGIPTLKVHSKICLIKRLEAGREVGYAHIGTGNFHERTARTYTDFSLFTTHPGITKELDQLFEFISHSYKRFEFRHLLISPLTMRDSVTRLIQREINIARAGRAAKITLKVNNLVDERIIDQLYAASQAGVTIRLIVRGMCALKPGIAGLSENISAISIVDRFLEHPRVLIFGNDGDPDLFISSADLMARNLDGRVEVGCPIYDPALKQRVLDIIALQLNDTVKARLIDPQQRNDYVERVGRRKIRSQLAIFDHLKKNP